jgi:hypothetical protein
MAGWYVAKRAMGPETWVVNENQLEAYLDHEPVVLVPDDIKRLSAAVADHVRGHSGK